MGAPLMGPEAAAWVRAHAWTAAMRKTFAEVPGFYLACACQYGTTPRCQMGQCGRCGRGEPLRSTETAIVSRATGAPAAFLAAYAHRTDVSATGPRYEQTAQVWLADRVCRWACPHDCHHRRAPSHAAGHPGQRPAEATARAADEAEQGRLF